MVLFFRVRLAAALLSSSFSRNFSLLLLVMVIAFLGYEARPIKNHHQQRSKENKQNGDQIPSSFDKLKVSPENFDKIRHFHDTLYHEAVKALIGQVGRQHYNKLTEAEKQKLAKCLARIESRKKNVVDAAKCLVESKKRQHFVQKRTMEWGERQLRKMTTDEEEMVPFVQEEEEEEKVPPFVGKEEKKAKTTGKEKSKLHFQLANKSKRLLRYMGKTRRRKGTSSFLINGRRNDQNRTVLRKASEEGKTITDRRNVVRQVVREKRSTTNGEETFKSVSMLSSASLASRADKSIGSRVTNLIAKLLDGRRSDRTNERWQNVYGRLRRLAKTMERRKRFSGNKMFEKRMYDIVLDREEASLSPEEKHSPVGLLQEGLKLIDFAIANRTTPRSPHNVRLFSPRFMPLTPDKGGSLHNNSLLSPTLLALYDEQDNGSIGNVPEMLRNAGVGEKERLELIGTLMDITGTTEQAAQTTELFKETNMFNDGVGGPLMETADRIVRAFFALEDSMDAQQKEQCERNGYTFARKAQIEQLFRDQAVDLSKLPELETFNVYDRMSQQEKEAALWATIEQIAAASGNASAHPQKRRAKRTFATRVLEPTILSPFSFTFSRGFAVLGPTILSPNVFSPSILAPTVLSPHILSPNLFRPQILSPTLMSPAILTPLVVHPYVLSPAVLGSLILNPTILTPFILTPVVGFCFMYLAAISPSILNPFALSPVVFSPLLLAPDIVSPQTLGGAIFSPVMLSPAILTQAYLMVSIFSPSFLS